jgi:3-phosphoshikimate 1-carboxyvinyltransferase
MSLPTTLEIVPLRQPPDATIRVPGSKSMTNRALVLAALSSARANCTVRGALHSEDTELMIDGLRRLGFAVRADWRQQPPIVEVMCQAEDRAGGEHNLIPCSRAELFLGNSGTCMRFLTALVSLGHGRYRLDGVPRMRQRPIEDLLAGLRQLGAKACSEDANGCPPVLVEAAGLDGGTVRIRGGTSSQFLSALLMVAPLARRDVTIVVEGQLVSAPYVDMTLHMIRQAGIATDVSGAGQFIIRGGQEYRASQFQIEPDASAASYFFAAAAITGGTVRIPGLSSQSLQGDVRFVDILGEMGCKVTTSEGSLVVRGGALRGVEVDMAAISDCVMTLAAVACFAKGPTRIRNIAHIRHKESDRLQALTCELRRLRVAVEESADGILITPGDLCGAEIETYNDHRMAMAMSLVGLKVGGIIIRNSHCVAKTYPNFFADFNLLYHPGTSQ